VNPWLTNTGLVLANKMHKSKAIDEQAEQIVNVQLVNSPMAYQADFFKVMMAT